MKKKIPATEDVLKDIAVLYELAERSVGAQHNIVRPIYERIINSIVEDSE